MFLKNAFRRGALSSIFSRGQSMLILLSKAGVSLKSLIILLFVIVTLGTGFSFHYLTAKPTNIGTQQASNRAVLGSSIALDPNKLNGNIVFNIPATFNDSITVKGLTVNGDETVQGNLILEGKSLDAGQGTIKASNLLYGITAGTGISSTGGQDPTISNTGVLSLQGLTGAVNLTAGSGISISGTTISNTLSSANTFNTIKVGSTSFSAGSSADTLTLAAGTGVTLSTDTTNKIVTITNSGGGGGGSVNFGGGVTGTLGASNGGTGLTSYNAGDLLYASGTTALSTLGIGGANSVLTSSGTAPQWSNSLTLSGLTVNGSLTLGNNTSETITPTARFAGSLIPSSTDTIDLGSTSLEFNNIFAKNIISPSTNGTAGYLQLNSGVLSPTNITNDFAIGGISTSSAKFQVTSGGAISQATGIVSSGNITFSGLGTGVVHSSSGTLSSSAVALGSEVSGQLGVGNGGTGVGSFTTNGLLYGNGNSALQVTSAGTNGQVLEANNLGVPTWSNLSVSAGSGGSCSNCLSINPSTSQIINPTGISTTGLSVAQTSTSSPTGDIFNVTNSSGSTKYLQIDSNGNTSVGGNVTFTNSASTTLGTSVVNAWTLNGNSFNNRRSITVTNSDPTNTLSVNYEVTLSFTGATATDICSKTRSDNNDLRISYGMSTEISRDITTRNCNTSLTVTFLLQAAIAPNNSDTYYIYYNNSSLNSAGPTYVSSTSVVDNADAVSNFTSSDTTYTPITQDTVTKQEGTGSVKIAVKGGTPGIVPSTSTGADGTLDLSLGSSAGGCTGTGLSWNAGTSTCTINDATKSTFNFTTINIPSGTTLTETGTTAVPTLLATGTVTIAGTINLNSTGNPSGTGPGAGTSCTVGSCSTPAGGGSYGGAGGAASSGYAAGPTYTGINFGSAGGYENGYQAGGSGGGGIQITTAGNMTMSGTVNAVGGSGGCFGSACSGGGSGGGVMLEANNLTVSGTINASGGNGAALNGSNYGGAGGGGRIFLDYVNSINTTGSTLTLSGGTTGQAGGGGSAGVSAQRIDITSINQTVITTKSAMDLSTYGAVCFYVRSDATGQYVQFGFGKTSISEQTYNITINSANAWSQQCFNIASLSTSARQNITKFGFTINNAPASNVNFWFDYIVAQTTAGFSGSAPTLNTGATLLGTTNLTLNGQGLGGVKLNYDPTNGLAGTGGLSVYNGSSTSLFSIDGSGNASQSGNLIFTGSSDVIDALNGSGLSFQTSVGGDSGLTSRMTLLNNGNFGIGTTTPGSLLDIIGGTVGIGTTSPLATLDVRGNSFNTPGASISGAFGKAALVVDNSGIGDIFTASSSGLSRFVIAQSGNVGIGTATPTRNLDIVGNAANNSNGNSSQLSIYGASSSNNRLNIGYNTTSNYGWIEAVNQNSAWQNLYLQPTGGSVGINTTSANAELSLGTSVQTNKLYLYDNTNDKYGFGVATNTLQIYSGAASGNNATIAFGKYDGTTFSEFMRLQNGNLGINTGANPTASLDVRATSFTTPVGNLSGSTGVATLVLNNSSGGDIFTASSAGATKFVVTSSGVGIGKAVPGASLDVAGNLSVSTYATVSASLSIGSYSAPAGSGNAVFSGQVGIGTSSPTQALSVAGNESVYNSATGRGDIYTTVNIDKTWNTTTLFNSAGATFSAGLQNPATNNQLNLNGPSPIMLNGWNYRKPITVNNLSNSNTLSNYQVKVTLDTASLITATKMNSSCSDLRFTDSDGQTTLNYWIESGCNTSSTIVWVKVPSITASSNYTIYAYYGNSGAVAASSSSNTFVRSISNVQLAYRLDEATATGPTDYSGNGFTGTSTGTSVVAGQFNNARLFNGTSDYINVPTSATLNSNTLTFVAWVKGSSLIGSIIGSSSNGGPQFRINGGVLDLVKEGQVDIAQSTSAVPSNAWVQVAVTYDGTNYKFYINGAAAGSGSNTQTFSFSNYWVGRGFNGGEYFSGSIDEVRIYNKVLSSAEILDLYNNYGYVTTNSANTEYVRAFSSPEPSTSVGSETSAGYSSGLQSWTSNTIDAGAGNTYRPNFLTVTYILDGSDNIAPKFQIEGSNTGSFTGEQSVYPNGYASYFQNGSSYSISNNTQTDISAYVSSRYRYWKVIAYMDTGSTTTDTPIISSIRLQDNTPNLSLFANGNVGIGNTNAAFKLDVQDGEAATVAAMIRNTNTGTTASGLGIALGANTPGTSNYFLSFLDGKGEIIGKVQGNGSSGVTYNTGGADFAEYFQKQNPSEELLPGKIVCQGNGGITDCKGGQRIVGVISANAGFVGAGNHDNDPNYVLVGLIGQLPVNFSTASGTINPGDSITTDSKGNAVKALGEGQIVGTAIQGSDQSDNGKILVNVNVSWYNPTALFTTFGIDNSASISSKLQDLALLSQQNATVSGSLNVLGRATVTDLGVTGNIQTGILAVEGLNGEIDTFGGPLKLEATNIESVDIENGKVIIDPFGDITSQGNITAQNVNAQHITAGALTISNSSSSASATVLSASTGVATLPAGQTTLVIQTTAVTPTARIFVTPQIPVAVGAVVTGAKEFTITIGSPQSKNIQVNWWIVQ